ncbi:uncharacterized protein [Palaemon carinicauda]|uniref:uncharacterized protein n=1 Tax=Palaemon carinicauda TaxID=392227 RepID=UPI0035B59C18
MENSSPEKRGVKRKFEKSKSLLPIKKRKKHLATFLGSSLDSLASEYFRDGRKARLMKEMLSGIKNEELRAEVIQGKLPFCYDYIDSLSKLEERQLPPQSAFYNRLKAHDLLDEEYKRAQRVWTIGKCQTLKDFLLVYLIVDTTLLGDILIWWRDILYIMTRNLPTSGIHKLSDEEKDLFLGRGIENVITNKDKGYWLLVTTKVPSEEVARAMKKSPLEIYPTILYIDLVLELEAVHLSYEFNQSAYMSDFIKTNIEARTAATSSTEKRAFKTMSNCVFGKTLLNPLKYAEKSRAVTKAAVYLKEARNLRLKSAIRLSEDRVICTSTLPQVAINMPNYIGFAILEAAKFDLYYFFYKILKHKYSDKVKLIYTDTDSFIFALEVPDLNLEFAQEPLKSYMDFSNFDVDHPLFNNERKGELGLLKSETGSTLIAEVKALKPKMYSLLLANQEQINRVKGIPRHVHSRMKHDQYSQILEDHRVNYVTLRTIRNVQGQMSTTKVEKKCLSAFDTKRHHVSQYSSYAYSHLDIVEEEDDQVAREVPTNNPLPKLVVTPYSPPDPLPRVYQNLWKKREEKVGDYFPLPEGNSSALA